MGAETTNTAPQCADTSGLQHRPADGSAPTELATRVYAPNSTWERVWALGQLARGDTVAIVVSWPDRADRRVRMFAMPFAIDALWLTADTVQRTARVGPWWDTERASGDTVIELPAGTAADVVPGDTIVWDQAPTDP